MRTFATTGPIARPDGLVCADGAGDQEITAATSAATARSRQTAEIFMTHSNLRLPAPVRPHKILSPRANFSSFRGHGATIASNSRHYRPVQPLQQLELLLFRPLISTPAQT